LLSRTGVISYHYPLRGVAQPGSAPAWGAGGRRFKSSRPDQIPTHSPRGRIHAAAGLVSLTTLAEPGARQPGPSHFDQQIVVILVTTVSQILPGKNPDWHIVRVIAERKGDHVIEAVPVIANPRAPYITRIEIAHREPEVLPCFRLRQNSTGPGLRAEIQLCRITVRGSGESRDELTPVQASQETEFMAVPCISGEEDDLDGPRIPPNLIVMATIVELPDDAHARTVQVRQDIPHGALTAWWACNLVGIGALHQTGLEGEATGQHTIAAESLLAGTGLARRDGILPPETNGLSVRNMRGKIRHDETEVWRRKGAATGQYGAARISL